MFKSIARMIYRYEDDTERGAINKATARAEALRALPAWARFLRWALFVCGYLMIAYGFVVASMTIKISDLGDSRTAFSYGVGYGTMLILFMFWALPALLQALLGIIFGVWGGFLARRTVKQ